MKTPHHYSPIKGVDITEIVDSPGFWARNALKYVWRAPLKNGVADVDKCIDCMERLFASVSNATYGTPGILPASAYKRLDALYDADDDDFPGGRLHRDAVVGVFSTMKVIEYPGLSDSPGLFELLRQFRGSLNV